MSNVSYFSLEKCYSPVQIKSDQAQKGDSLESLHKSPITGMQWLDHIIT